MSRSGDAVRGEDVTAGCRAGERRRDAIDDGGNAVAAADRVFALKTERQTEVVHLEDVDARGVALDRVEALEEAFTGGVLVEVDELERLEHPLLASRPRRAKELLVDERDDRVFRVVEVALLDAEIEALPLHVFEERADAAIQDIGRR